MLPERQNIVFIYLFMFSCIIVGYHTFLIELRSGNIIVSRRLRAYLVSRKKRDWSDTPSRKGISGSPQYRGGCCQGGRLSDDNCALLLTSDDRLRSLAATGRSPRDHGLSNRFRYECINYGGSIPLSLSLSPIVHASFSRQLCNKISMFKYKYIHSLLFIRTIANNDTSANFPLITKQSWINSNPSRSSYLSHSRKCAIFYFTYYATAAFIAY